MSLPAAPPITLTTPSLGVRQWRDDADPGRTCIAWATTGGRGLPRSAILLPVAPVEGRWKPSDALLAALPDQLRHVRHLVRDLEAVYPESREDPAAPRRLTVASNCGQQWGAHHLVVLLVYDEPRAVGDQGDLSQVVTAVEVEDVAAHQQEIKALEEFFDDECYDDRLVTRGLVRLPALDATDTPGTLVFALASCQYPADMTDGAGGGPEPPASASLLRLSKLLTPAAPEAPSLLVLAGDQVYVDATAGLFDARATTDRLRLPYQNLMGSPGAQAVFGLLPIAMVIDDHEIIDNWEPGVPIPAPTTKGQAMDAYRRFQRMAGPRLRDEQALWCEFTYSGVPFFLGDTRTERHTPDETPRGVANWREARIMRPPQWDALVAFLRRNAERVAFVITPSMLLPRDLGVGPEPSLALEADDWDGYPASRDALLALLCELDAQRVVFLSGDAHTSCVAEATVTRGAREARLWSVHSSGLYCPYPFANGAEDDYAVEEIFDFPEGAPNSEQYHCVIRKRTWAPGDGFATLNLKRHDDGYTLDVCFKRAGGDVPAPTLVMPDRARVS